MALESFVPHTVLEQPTAEMRWWHRSLRPVFAPGSIVGTALVTPLAHVAPLSVDFQTYLYDVFHRHWVSRVAHATAMPLILAAGVGIAAQLHPALGWVCTALVAASTGAMATSRGMALPAALGVVATVGCGALGQRWAVGPILGVGPVVGLFLLGLLQTLSHVFEPDVPPRASGSDRWIPVRAYFAAAPVPRVFRSAGMLLAGTCNEIWASSRLLPVVIRELLWRVGWDRAGARRHAALLHEAMRDQNPAIDFVGSGGASDLAYRP